jgi:hypothetical protein
LEWVEYNYCFLFINKKEFPLQKDKPLRHRLGSDNRLKDERGNHRERDNRANGSEKYDRSENPQSSDFQSNNDGSDGGNLDEPMYETFGGQGMRVAPFPSDIPPPPVLMPVPGAGYVDSASKM